MSQVRPILQRSEITEKNKFLSTIDYSHIDVSIEEDLYLAKSIKTKTPYLTRDIDDKKSGSVKINEVLPFRIKFINTGVTGYNVPPIGIAIIGYNNYIL